MDIDGVLLANDLRPANYSREFLKKVINQYPTFWLSVRCKGDALEAVRILADFFEPQIISLLQRVQPTNWDIDKTEAIDFKRPFLWFDDELFDSERRTLIDHGVLGNWIEVDLTQDENQLADFLLRFPVPVDSK